MKFLKNLCFPTFPFKCISNVTLMAIQHASKSQWESCRRGLWVCESRIIYCSNWNLIFENADLWCKDKHIFLGSSCKNSELILPFSPLKTQQITQSCTTGNPYWNTAILSFLYENQENLPIYKRLFPSLSTILWSPFTFCWRSHMSYILYTLWINTYVLSLYPLDNFGKIPAAQSHQMHLQWTHNVGLTAVSV